MNTYYHKKKHTKKHWKKEINKMTTCEAIASVVVDATITRSLPKHMEKLVWPLHGKESMGCCET
jgi:hypothetical protein